MTINNKKFLVPLYPVQIKNPDFQHMNRTYEELSKEQKNLTLSKCPKCKQDVWISKAKRDILKSNKEIRALCWDCISYDPEIRRNSAMQDIKTL